MCRPRRHWKSSGLLNVQLRCQFTIVYLAYKFLNKPTSRSNKAATQATNKIMFLLSADRRIGCMHQPTMPYNHCSTVSRSMVDAETNFLTPGSSILWVNQVVHTSSGSSVCRPGGPLFAGRLLLLLLSPCTPSLPSSPAVVSVSRLVEALLHSTL